MSKPKQELRASLRLEILRTARELERLKAGKK